VHVALRRGHEGEPPPAEDHHLAAVAKPEIEGLAAAVERSRSQMMALDLLEDRAADPPPTAAGASDRTEAPMTEAQIATLARRGVTPDRDLTWVQASLLIDQATGAPRARRAAKWLRENGASKQEIPAILERAEQIMRPANGSEACAVRERMRERRRAWARQAPASTPEVAVDAGLAPGGRPPPGRRRL
jgi:hypothetical protein